MVSRRRALLTALALVLPLLLAGCVARGPVVPSEAVSPDSWQLDGRLALSNGRDGGSGTLTWTQQPNLSQLAFVGAFGRGGWRLTVNPQRAELLLSDGQSSVAPQVGELVAQATGWQIPVAALTYWVTGRIQPGFAAESDRNAAGHLDVLKQHGWRVQFEGRLPAGNGTLPRKITATRGKDRVRLLVKRWELPQT